jgi:uncharacterized protein YcfJ
MKFQSKLAVITGALVLTAAPAFAAAGPPATTPPGYNASSNPGSTHVPTNDQARALGRKECQEFKLNFGDNKSQFGKCVSAAAQAIHTDQTPRQTCNQQGLSHKPQGDEHRSDFSSCVIAGARAQREDNSNTA